MILRGDALAIDPADVEDALDVDRAAADAGDELALVVGERRQSFRDLAAAVRAAGPGEPVVTARGDLATALAIYTALARRRPIALLHDRLGADTRADLAARARRHRPDGAAALLFSSGSTGEPKGVILSRRALVASARAGAALSPWRPGDRWLACLSLAHIGGLSILTRCLAARRALILCDGFDTARVAATLVRERITHLSLVPTMLDRLLTDPSFRPPPSLRVVFVGGAASTSPLLKRARDRGVPVVLCYGMSESCAQIYSGDRALPGAEIRIAADGRIELRGPMLLSGYLPPHDRDPIFDADGWFRAGDRGVIQDGLLRVTGRADDVIVTGGENVDPVAVERVLESVAGVRAACVFPVADETWGHIVAAALVTDDDAAVDAAWARAAAELPSFAIPRRVARLAALALGPTGKLDRRRTAATAMPALRSGPLER